LPGAFALSVGCECTEKPRIQTARVKDITLQHDIRMSNPGSEPRLTEDRPRIGSLPDIQYGSFRNPLGMICFCLPSCPGLFGCLPFLIGFVKASRSFLDFLTFKKLSDGHGEYLAARAITFLRDLLNLFEHSFEGILLFHTIDSTQTVLLLSIQVCLNSAFMPSFSFSGPFRRSAVTNAACNLQLA